MIKKILFIFLSFVVLATCESRESNQNSVKNICGQEPCYEGPFDPPWVSGLRFNSPWDDILTHDNRVLETNNFLVFSDASSDEAKIQMGKIAEAALELIKNLFNISSEDLGIRDRDSKFQVYSARRADKSYPRAFNDGFVANTGQANWGKNELILSVASIWEMHIKMQLGKLRLTHSIKDLISTHRATYDLQILPIFLNHILALGTFWGQTPSRHTGCPQVIK